MIYYKVVLDARIDLPHQYVSVVVGHALQVFYNLGTRSYPPIGGLLAFDSLPVARRWVRQNEFCNRAKILKGQGKRRRLCRFRSPWWPTKELAHAAWHGKGPKRGALPWPDGTVALEWFEPEEEVT